MSENNQKSDSGSTSYKNFSEGSRTYNNNEIRRDNSNEGFKNKTDEKNIRRNYSDNQGLSPLLQRIYFF